MLFATPQSHTKRPHENEIEVGSTKVYSGPASYVFYLGRLKVLGRPAGRKPDEAALRKHLERVINDIRRSGLADYATRGL
jgi:hypothetical protein